MISDIIIDIIRNHENKKQLLKNIWFIVISLPFDLIIFYSPDLIPFNIRPLKILRIFKIFKILIILEIFKYFIDKKSQQNLERVNKKIKANTIAYVISTILLLSGIGLSYVENIKGLDIFYFIFVTFSSVGYGDVVVSTMYGKIIAIIISLLSILGIGFLSALFLTYVNIDQEKETISNEEFNDLKGEVNILKEQNEEIIKLLKNAQEK